MFDKDRALLTLPGCRAHEKMTFAVAVRCDDDADVQAKVRDSDNVIFFLSIVGTPTFCVPAACLYGIVLNDDCH
jgi:hypothetical protein